MILVIAANKTAFDEYRRQQKLSPNDCRHVYSLQQLRGYENTTPCVAVGNYYENKDAKIAANAAIEFGFKVQQVRI